LRQKSNVPVIFLTSNDEQIDELFGLKIGADDFIREPSSQRLLVERVKAVLRRAAPKDSATPEARYEVLDRGLLRMHAANRDAGRRSARPGNSAAVASAAASTIVGQKFPAPSGSVNAADKSKMKCRSARAADIKQECRSTRARARAMVRESR
jgi:hypothetical protein